MLDQILGEEQRVWSRPADRAVAAEVVLDRQEEPRAAAPGGAAASTWTDPRDRRA